MILLNLQKSTVCPQLLFLPRIFPVFHFILSKDSGFKCVLRRHQPYFSMAHFLWILSCLDHAINSSLDQCVLPRCDLTLVLFVHSSCPADEEGVAIHGSFTLGTCGVQRGHQAAVWPFSLPSLCLMLPAGGVCLSSKSLYWWWKRWNYT